MQELEVVSEFEPDRLCACPYRYDPNCLSTADGKRREDERQDRQIPEEILAEITIMSFTLFVVLNSSPYLRSAYFIQGYEPCRLHEPSERQMPRALTAQYQSRAQAQLHLWHE